MSKSMPTSNGPRGKASVDRQTKKKRWTLLLLILCAVIALGVAVMADGPEALWKALRGARIEFLLCGAGCMLVYWLLEAFIFYLVCRALKCKIGFGSSFHVSMIGQLFNCITPFASGGQPIQAYVLTKKGMLVGHASSALLAKFIVYQVMLTVYSVFVVVLELPFFLGKVSGFSLLALLGFGINTFVMLLILGVGFFPKATTAVLLWFVKLLSRIKLIKDREKAEARIHTETANFYDKFSVLKRRLHHFILPCLISVVQLTAFFTVPYFVCRAVSNDPMPYGLVLSAAAFILMISSFVPLPGGSGGAEGGFYLFFGMFFSSAGLLSAAMLLWRFLTFYFPILAGLMAYRADGKPEPVSVAEES